MYIYTHMYVCMYVYIYIGIRSDPRNVCQKVTLWTYLTQVYPFHLQMFTSSKNAKKWEYDWKTSKLDKIDQPRKEFLHLYTVHDIYIYITKEDWNSYSENGALERFRFSRSALQLIGGPNSQTLSTSQAWFSKGGDCQFGNKTGNRAGDAPALCCSSMVSIDYH